MSGRQYRALVVTFLRIAWRGPAATEGARGRRGAMAWGFLGYLVIGGFLMLATLVLDDPRLCGFVLQSMSFMMVALSFLNIYGDLVFDARDVPQLFWRPIDPRAYLAARLTAIVVYFAAVTAALNLPGALVVAARFGPPWYPAAHMLGAFVGALAALLLALLLLFVLLKAIGRERLRDTVAWVQIGATLFFVAGNQLFARVGVVKDFSAAQPVAGGVAFFLPMSWAQAVADVLSGRSLPGEASVMAVGVAAPLGLGAFLVTVFARSYGDILRALGEADARREAPVARGRLRRVFERAAAGDPTTRAGFLLAWATIRRARDYKVRALPQFGLPVVFCLMSAVQGAPPFAAVATGMLALAACQALVCMVGSEHAEAGWVWTLAPHADPEPALRGAALAILGALVVPVLVLLGGVMAFTAGPVRAAGSVFIAAGLTVASLRWMRRLVDRFPCTSTLEEARRQSLGVEAIALLFAAMLVAGVDAFLAYQFGAWVSFVLAAPFLFWGWRGLAARR